VAERSWDGGGQPFVLRLLAEEVGGQARELAGSSLLAWSVPEKAAALEQIAAAARALEAAHLNLVRSPSGEDLSAGGATSVPALLGPG
jgi:hypothetical protein